MRISHGVTADGSRRFQPAGQPQDTSLKRLVYRRPSLRDSTRQATQARGM